MTDDRHRWLRRDARLIKIAARVTELKTLIRVQWPTACPDQHIFRLALARIPRLIT
jgi:hypothetical protein